ncbi:hypothetical protein NKJ81_28920 [Mesorhizobium sp. M0018]|uniref:hypothetical protein n=1 Tax=Mesorhizobium sp. M0018 TaxID=2956844 RepID=UPI003339DC19
MSYVPYPTGTLLVPSGPGKHLFIVVTKKCKDGFHLLFSVSSVKEGVFYDKSCEFAGGEHVFIKHASFVLYRLADQKKAAVIAKLVDKNLYSVKPDLDEKHFKRVCRGIGTSKFVAPWALKYYLANKP